MNIIFTTSSPNNPTINTHNGIICIDKHIAKKSIYPKQIDKDKRTNNSRWINQNISFFGKNNTKQSKNNSNNFYNNKMNGNTFILFEKPIKKMAHSYVYQILLF